MEFRIARHTNQINQIKTFYTEVLELEVLGSFANHDGYDGVFIGRKDLGWHLEFTTTSEEPDHRFDHDDILVFYPRSKDSYDGLLRNIDQHKLKILSAKNPYWNANGVMVQDPDGHRVVISNSKAG